MTVATTARKAEMGCKDFEPFIDAYIDEEFGERERADMEAHLDICKSCRCKVQTQLKFKQQLQQHLGEKKAPDSLRDRVLAGLEEIEIECCDEAATTKGKWRTRVHPGWVVGPLAAMVALAVVLPEFTVAPAASSPATMIDSTVDWHQGNFPLEVTTADTREAQEWFEDKVDFSVRLPQFDDDRVNLLGGRIAHIEDRRAAFLLYEVDGSRMSAILFDGDGIKVPRENLRRMQDRDIAWLNQKGYGVAVVQDSGVTYAMISDLAEDRFLNLVSDSVDN